MSKVIIYKGKDNVDEIAFECSVLECLRWGGYGVCDLCNESEILNDGRVKSLKSVMYLCPELGSKALCEKCFKDHQKRVKWYEEDLQFTLDMIDIFRNNYVTNLSIEDKQLVEDFKISKINSNK